MRVLVCGGRDYRDRKTVEAALDALSDVSLIIEGGATGADLFASEWAVFRKVERRTFRADWNKHGKAAGPIRNREMLETGKPDLVLAFPGGRGTADMVRQAERAGVPVKKVGTS